MPRARLIAAALLCVGFARVPASAHPVPFSYLDLRVVEHGLEGTLVVHILDVAHDLDITPADRLLDARFASERFAAVRALLDRRLRIDVNGARAALEWTRLEVLPDRQSLRLHVRGTATSVPASVHVDARLFPYDPNHRTFLNIYEGEALTQAILDRSRPTFDFFAGTRQGTVAVVRKFLPSGIHHILIGPDHLLFLFGLLLLGGSVARLLLIVSGFTVAHSITLSLAALGVVSPPASIVEPAIALSIVYVGVDNLLVRQGRDVRPWIAVAFGLIHGFGFANVLRAMDLPGRALGWSLFSFNVGVEVGQLLVVALSATALAAVRRWRPSAGRPVAIAGSAAVIAAGAFWFVERVFFSGGIR